VTVAATRFGRPLPKGGCIGVPAPASPWENRSDLLRGSNGGRPAATG
jgi:hypothetical protein